MWQLSGIPCVHEVVAYTDMKMEPGDGVNNLCGKEMWVGAYKFSIRPVGGSTLWRKTNDILQLPQSVRIMPGRP